MKARRNVTALFAFFALASQSARCEDSVEPANATPNATRITQVAEGIVRVQVAPKGAEFRQSPFTSVLPDLHGFKGGQTVKVVEKDGVVTVNGLDGKPLVSQTAVTFAPSTVNKQTYPSARVTWRSERSDALFGLGSYQGGNLNLRGQRREMKQENVEDTVPMFFSTAGFGILWDNPSLGSFQAAEQGEFSIHATCSDLVDYYVIVGKTPDEVIAGYRKLTGTAAMLPKWAFGYHQSRERYDNQGELMEVARRFRDLKFPIDLIIQDWQYWGRYGWNACRFDEERFADAKGMLDELKAMNIKCIISVWPSFGKGYLGETPSLVYNELKEGNMLSTTASIGGSHFYNPFSPEAREIVWKHTQKGLWDIGVDGWWLDSPEPHPGPMSWGDVKLPDSFDSIRNAYPFYVVKVIFDGQHKAAPDRRFFTLTRSAYAGSQRAGISYWTGDTRSDWDTYRNQIQACLGMSAAGIPYVNHDIGGFNRASRSDSFRELYLRWFQLGTFTPEMRSHGTGAPREPWEFTERVKRKGAAEGSALVYGDNGALDFTNSDFFGWKRLGTPAFQEREWRFTSFSLPMKELRVWSDSKGRDVTFYENVPKDLEGWHKPGFDDSAWQKGLAPIGKGELNIKGKDFPIRSKWGEGNVLLMRTTFELDSLDYTAFRFWILHKQAHHVYLNGHKVRWYPWETGTAYRKVDTYSMRRALAKHLKKGTNVVAVYAMEKDGKDAVDLFFEGQVEEGRLRAAKEYDPEYNIEEDRKEVVYDTLWKFTDLRYQLLPYIYSTAWKVTDEGYTMMRPLAMDFPSDPSIYNTTDKFMFGPALLVAPVFRPTGSALDQVPSSALADKDKQAGGLTATYFKGQDLKTPVVTRKDPGVAFAWDQQKNEGFGELVFRDPVPGLGNMSSFSACWEGYLKTDKAGTYTVGVMGNGRFRLTVDGKLLLDGWKTAPKVPGVKVEFPADSQIPVRLEYAGGGQEPSVTLAWMPPGAVTTQDVNLPGGADWYDFWTGTFHKGGKTYTMPAPLSSMPLFVRAGSILPFGPKLQHTGEKTDKPCELRIYPGADAVFKLYNDAGDGYGYEKGERAIVPLKWDDAKAALTIGAREGSYPGMTETENFIVRLLQKDGSWKDLPVTYTGQEKVCKFSEKPPVPEPADIMDSSEHWEPVDGTLPSDRIWEYTTVDLDPEKQYLYRDNKRRSRTLAGTVPDEMKSWLEPDFDASKWRKGPAPIGKDTRPEKTDAGMWKTLIRSPWGDGNILLMRTSFALNKSDFVKYRLRLKCTNSFLVYLNGQVIQSYPFGRNHARWQIFHLDEKQAQYLTQGTNVLAFYVNFPDDEGKRVNAVDLVLEGINQEQLDDIRSKEHAEGNPIITHIYTADPTARAFNGRVYVYASHDEDTQRGYEMIDYHVFSSDDMANWQDHGVALRAKDIPWAKYFWAPTCVFRDGTYYLYFPNGDKSIGVATSKTPYGPFKDALGKPLIDRTTPGGEDVSWIFDPDVFIDDDGQAYLYYGGGRKGENARIIKLKENMIETEGSAVKIAAPHFFEASFIHKRNGLYYFSYSTPAYHKRYSIDYMMSTNPVTGWEHKGTVLGNPPDNFGNNNHHSIMEFEGKWYMFYHNRRVAGRNGVQRSINVDRLYYNEDGTMQTVIPTRIGIEQLKNVDAFARNEVETFQKQKGIETEGDPANGVWVTFQESGDWIRISKMDFGRGAGSFMIHAASETEGGAIEIRLDRENGPLVGTCSITNTGGSQAWQTFSCDIVNAKGVHDVYFCFKGGAGPLYNLDWYRFVEK
jgi:arabinoxylan arabinofuranohydrolase